MKNDYKIPCSFIKTTLYIIQSFSFSLNYRVSKENIIPICWHFTNSSPSHMSLKISFKVYCYNFFGNFNIKMQMLDCKIRVLWIIFLWFFQGVLIKFSVCVFLPSIICVFSVLCLLFNELWKFTPHLTLFFFYYWDVILKILLFCSHKIDEIL